VIFEHISKQKVGGFVCVHVSYYIPLLVSDVPVPPASRPRTASPTNPVESLQGSPRAPVFICCARDVLIRCVCVCVCVCARAAT